MTELLSRLIEAVAFNTKRIAEHEECLKLLVEYTAGLCKLAAEMKKTESTQVENKNQMYWRKLTFDRHGNLECFPNEEGIFIFCTKSGHVFTEDVFYDNKEWFLDGTFEWEDIAAWMPFPEPYREEQK